MINSKFTSVLVTLVALPVFFSNTLFGQSKQFKTKVWKFDTNGKIFTTPVIYDRVIYFGSSDKSFYAVDADTGTLIWRFATGGAVNSGAAIDGDLICFGSTDGFYYALNYEDGSPVWKFKTGGENVYDSWDYYLSTPVFSEELVYFGSGDKNIYALNKKSGEAVWTYETEGIIHTRGEVVGGNICFGSFDGNMYCLDKVTGQLKWKFDTVGTRHFPKGEIQSSATLHDGVLYFGSRDYVLYALDAETGTGIWIEPTPSWVIAKPIVKDGNVYVGNSDGPRCYAYDAEHGQKLWEYRLFLNIFGSALVSESEVFYPSFDGKIYALDRESGKLNYTIKSDLAEVNFANIFTEERKIKKPILDEARAIGHYGKLYDLLHTLGSVLSAPVQVEDRLYFTSTDGALYAYGY